MVHAAPASSAKRQADAKPPARAFQEFDQVLVNPPGAVVLRDLTVENSLGDVRIEGHDGDSVVVNARKTATSAEALKRLSVGFTPLPGGAVSIGTKLSAGPEMRPLSAGAVKVDLVIQVPRNTRPLVRVWKGDVFIEGVDNGAEVAGNETDVNVRRVSGDVSSHVSRGQQQFWELVGVSLLASAIEGDLALDTVQGKSVEAWTHSGQVTARGLRVKKLALRTVRGDIFVRARVLPKGAYEISSYYGDVEFQMDDRAPLHVTARSQAGHIGLPDELRERTLEGGEPLLFAQSRKGDLASLRIQSNQGDVRVSMHFDF